MIQVRSCQVGRMYRSGAGTIFYPPRHIIIECPWIEHARAVTHRDDLFLYRHAKSGNYMLAYWIAKPNTGEGPGYFMDLEDMPCHPDKFKGENGRKAALGMAMVRARLRPVDEMDRERERAEARQFYNEATALDESERQRKDAAKWLRRVGGNKLERSAWGVERGEGGYAGDMEGQQAKGIDIFGSL